MPLGNGERYYSPTLARFVQQDSFTGSLDLPASLNRFSYAHNNPNKFVDPSGNEPITISIAAIVAISFLVGVLINTIQQDQQIRSGQRKQEDFSLSEAAVANTIIGSSYRAATGEEAVTGQKLTNTERVVAAGETALEFFSVAGKVVGGINKTARVATTANLIGNAAELTQAGIGVYRGGAATADLIQEGRYGLATVTTGLTVLSAFGGYQSARGLRQDISDVSSAFRRSVNKSTDPNSFDAFMEAARRRINETRSRYGFSEASDNVVGMADDATVIVPTKSLRFSQRTAGGRGRAATLRKQLNEGWDVSKGSVDVIETKAGLVTFDNTRIAVASELGIPEVTAKMHRLGDLLPAGFATERGLAKQAVDLGLPVPKTWGEALRIRTMRNDLPLEGTDVIPRLPE